MKYLLLSLLVLSVSCGQKKVATGILEHEDVPDTVIDPCFTIPGDSDASCTSWHLKRLETGDETVSVPLDELLAEPSVIIRIDDFVSLKQFLFPLLKAAYRTLYHLKVTPQQFDTALDTLESDGV